MRKINKIILHCSESTFGDAETISKWHTDPPPDGNGWKDIGYHYVILNQYPKSSRVPSTTDGQLQFGRSVRDVGAHCYGENTGSIGICLIGTGRFTKAQNDTLKHLVGSLMEQYGISSDEVHGHYAFSQKTCPNFDVDEWVETELLEPTTPEITVNSRLDSVEERLDRLED